MTQKSKSNGGQETGTITRVSGPLVEASGLPSAKMYDVVKVSDEKLMGEVIEIKNGIVSIQVYEETSGIGPGGPVSLSGETMSVDLAPGLLGSIYDGVQRPLSAIEAALKSSVITRGVEAGGVDKDKLWDFVPVVATGQTVVEGDILGEVQETTLIKHKIMLPPGLLGTVEKIEAGNFTIMDTIAVIKDSKGSSHNITMLQRWPIRRPRPTKKKIAPNEPLLTGVRAIDTFFPIGKGGAGCIPGPFGAGKTVTQQMIAKYCNAQVIVYIGCGERGNEMTEVLTEFPELKDPNSGEPLMKRTVLIANTSNMPVAAREASVYTGITIAEYYRDMGYSVALMADSTSRWAEAMREISGRMEEMPGEEGYPAYLSSRTAEFYERAGMVETLGGDERFGSLSVVGAVSPPGGDLSEPVSQATLRVTKSFWALDAGLAYKKHFPSINWLNSYSLYVEDLAPYFAGVTGPDFGEVRALAMRLLQDESRLMEIVRLVGMESLSNEDKLTLEVAKMVREDFLFQNAYDERDAYTPIVRQYELLKSITTFYSVGSPKVAEPDFDFERLKALPSFVAAARMKEIDDVAQLRANRAKIETEINNL